MADTTVTTMEQIDKAKLLKQVEFYFSDANLRRDKFMKSILLNPDNQAGLVPLETLLTFNRVKTFMGISKDQAITEDHQKAFAEVLKASSVLKLSEDAKAISRVEEWKPENLKQKEKPKHTLRIEGFPQDTTSDQVQQFFNQVAGGDKVAYVELKRVKEDNVSKFTGVVFVEFISEESATEMCNKEMEYQGHQLKAMLLEAFKPTEPEKTSLLIIKGLRGKVSREELQSAISCDDMWVYYDRGEEEAIVEFQSLETANAGIEKFQLTIPRFEQNIKDSGEENVKVECFLAEGEAYGIYKKKVNERSNFRKGKRKGPSGNPKSSKKKKKTDAE